MSDDLGLEGNPENQARQPRPHDLLLLHMQSQSQRQMKMIRACMKIAEAI